MRTRNLKPGFFKNEELAACTTLARILFAGLWLLADRDGRLQDRPARIKAEVLPYDQCDVETLLSELCLHRFIKRYEVRGERYIAIPTFLDHQNPHPHETSQGFPSPEDAESRDMSLQGRDMSLTSPAFSYPPSPILPSPIHYPSLPRKGAARKKEAPEGFEEFWTAYPRKEAKPKAVEAWSRLGPDPQIRAAILDALARLRISARWLDDGGRYIPLPATFLNQRRWEDDLSRFPPLKPGGKNARSTEPSKRYVPERDDRPPIG